MNLELLKKAQAERGVMSKFLAEKLNTTRPTFSKKLRGDCPFYADDVKNISLALRLSLQEINDIFFDGQLPMTQSKSVNRKQSVVDEDK